MDLSMFENKNLLLAYDRSEMRILCGKLIDYAKKQKEIAKKSTEDLAEMKMKAHQLCELQKQLVLKELLPNPTAIELYGNRSTIESLVLKKAGTPKLSDIGNVKD